MPATPAEPETISCAACGVEFGPDRDALPEVCPICDDERQYVPATGQAWITQAEWASRAEVRVAELGPDQWGITAQNVGISQTMQLVRTPAGVLLWDPTGFVDLGTAEFIRSLGTVLAIVASHPHMYGAQVAWSRALGDPPVLVNAADGAWVQRRDPVLKEWAGTLALADGLELRTLGGHFPGSAIAHWSAGADGGGVVLAGDTIMVNSDRQTVSFLRSYPNRIPLSGAVVERIARDMSELSYRQLWSNFGIAITDGADLKVQQSAQRQIQWMRGDFDHLT
ncbi:hydrolase [Sinomonas sp. G460-2]|uniref:hydrolase n=1 Tax=Sinomonas sp. G460-2 TaxID=3393464 RepID=UPI0039EEFB84